VILRLREKKEGKLFVGNQQSIYRLQFVAAIPFISSTFVPCEHLKQSPEVDHPEPVVFGVNAEDFQVFVIKAVY
jgi:hypothetical protein